MSRKQDEAAVDPRWRSHVEPAPGDLRIVQAWVNTAGFDGVGEALRSPEALRDWLTHWDLLSRGAEIGPKDLELTLEVRSALRALIGIGVTSVPDPAAVAILNQAADAALLRVRFIPDGSVSLDPIGHGLAEALAHLFEIIARANRDQRWQRLKLCQRPDCSAAFYDFSNGLQAKWCSRRCGNRGSSRKYRGRRRRYRARKRGLRQTVV